MRSKYRPRVAPPPPPRRSAPWSMAVIGLILVAAGAVAALAVERLVKNAPGPGTNTAAAPSATFGPAASPLASAEAIASTEPATSPSPAAPVLEAEMPRAVNGTPLTTESALNATSLGNAPNGRALSAAVTSLGKKAGDLEIADAFDPSGSLALSILGFRLPGIDPVKLRSVVLDAWLSVTSPGITSTNVILSGTPSTRASYGDGGPDQYVIVHRDSVFIIVTADQSLAASAVAAMAGTSPSPSGG
jgi:hypothetical protein